MKKILLTAIAALCVGGAWAAPVSADRAKATAVAFIKGQTGRDVTVKEVVTQNDSYYILNLAQGGWVIVSADDTATPVLGYNTRGSMSWHTVPDNMRHILSDYTREMRAIKAAGIKTQNSAWRSVGSRMMSRAGASVDPLIQVNWNQTAPFNEYCPGSGNSKAIVGCVAVAMSQAMSVQRYPAQPQGTQTYGSANYGQITINYDAEKAYDWEAILKGTNRYNETARLLYHAGVSVEMDYGTEASGIPSNRIDRVTTALANNFGYNRDELRYIWRANYAGDWESLVLNELNAGRAVIYNAVDSKGNYGHSFNVDGYDGNHMYHVNWGWGGYGDGFFTLDNLSDASMGMNYDSSHVVVIGIGSPNQVLRSIELSDIVIDEKLPAGTVVAQVSVNGKEPESTYKLELFGPFNQMTNKYDEVPFKLQGDLLVTTEVLAKRTEPYEVNIRVEDSATNTRLTSSFAISVVELRTIAQATSVEFDRNSGDLLIKTRNGVNYTITGKNGVQLMSGTLSPVPHLTVNMNKLDEGENILTLSAGGETKTLRIKK
ncbi:MAG: hypothetical protein HDS11_06505 [Bacteroides sp.]|nr:hypothetical protein [Bacteroides sp.]MBD5377465.1 hypothetical protein [Bacteroides sp.]